MMKKFLRNENRRSQEAVEYQLVYFSSKKGISRYYLFPTEDKSNSKTLSIEVKELEYPMLTDVDTIFEELKSKVVSQAKETRNIIICYDENVGKSLKKLALHNKLEFA